MLILLHGRSVALRKTLTIHSSWNRLGNLWKSSSILLYYQDHPSAKNIVHHAISSAEQTSPDIPVIAAFSLCYRPIPAVTTHSQVEPISPPVKSVEPIFHHYRPFSSVFISSALLCCFLWIFTPAQFILLNLTRTAR